jgi:hypothetical protein
MYEALKENPQVTQIVVEYDGSGDDGQIQGTSFFDASGAEVMVSGRLEGLVEEYVYDALPGGWEINSGSYGTVTIDVPNQKASFDHYDRIEEAEHNPFED